LRSAGQPLQGAARPQEDEGKDPGDVDGGQGLGRHYRLTAADRDVPRLSVDAALHLAALDPSYRPAHAGRLRRLDVDRHHGDEEDDQLRFLTVLYGRVSRFEVT